jgi:hypothetical protein
MTTPQSYAFLGAIAVAVIAAVWGAATLFVRLECHG